MPTSSPCPGPARGHHLRGVHLQVGGGARGGQVQPGRRARGAARHRREDRHESTGRTVYYEPNIFNVIKNILNADETPGKRGIEKAHVKNVTADAGEPTMKNIYRIKLVLVVHIENFIYVQANQQA